MAQYVFKGALIGIEGRLQVRTYQNEAGIRQYISEVLVNRFFFLEARKNSATPEPMEPTYLQASSENQIHPLQISRIITITHLSPLPR